MEANYKNDEIFLINLSNKNKRNDRNIKSSQSR